jgi:hypothetical protein
MMGPGGMQRIGAIGERLGLEQIDPSVYAPGTINPMTGERLQRGDMTQLDPTGQDALRAAMIQAGIDMEAEGYSIDQAELRNVLDSSNDLYEPGDSAWDVQSRQRGGESFRDTYKAASDAALSNAEANEREQAEQRELFEEMNEQQVRNAVTTATSLTPEQIDTNMDVRIMASIVNDPGFNVFLEQARMLQMELFEEGKNSPADFLAAMRQYPLVDPATGQEILLDDGTPYTITDANTLAIFRAMLYG